MTTRQSELFAAQDWTVLYRAFRSINFSVSDPATINAALREYIRNTYPEDFSDWIESSEFVSILDLLSWLAGTLAYKTDLAARENFLDTAEARESIIRLARFLSYNPSRNRPARGILKLVSVRTDEDVVDSFGASLANQTITWNDPDDEDWFERFIAVMNAAMISTNPFGTPLKTGVLSNANAALYRLNNVLSSADLSFSSIVAGRSMPFSVVNGDFENNALIERTPSPTAALHLIHLQDGAGNASARTGLFFFFKQGTVQRETFNIRTPVENQTLDLGPSGVTQDDVWVQTVDDNGFVLADWTKVPAVFSENVTFNSIPLADRNIFSVITRDEDRVMIRFSDGRFGNAPVGLIRVTYRTANGLIYSIRPNEIDRISLRIPYISRSGATRALTMELALQEAVSNSTARETEEDIRRRAPLVYATQNRMVSGEDYNTFPLQSNLALKIKALNRVYSGHSRFNDLHDPTATYSDVSVFGDDGSLFIEQRDTYAEVPTTLNRTPRQMFDMHVQPMIRAADVVRYMRERLYEDARDTTPLNATDGPNGLVWNRTDGEAGTQSSTGWFSGPNPVTILTAGAAILFRMPDQRFRWAGIVETRGAVNVAPIAGVAGNVTLSEVVPTGSVILRVQPGYNPDIPVELALGADGFDSLFERRESFDLYYAFNQPTENQWRVRRSPSVAQAGEHHVLRARYSPGDPGIWRFFAKGQRFVFESEKTVEWYNSGKIAFDAKTGERKIDVVRVLRHNDDFYRVGTYAAGGTPIAAMPPYRAMANDWNLQLGALYAYTNGVYEPRRITFDFPDSDEDGVFDRPDTLERLMVDAPGRIEDRVLFWSRDTATMVETPRSDVTAYAGTIWPTMTVGVTLAAGDVGYLAGSGTQGLSNDFATWSGSSWVPVVPITGGSLTPTVFIARAGRGSNVARRWVRTNGSVVVMDAERRPKPLSFLWKHYAPSEHRIDPALTNVHDIFVLSTAYDTAMRDWISAGADPQEIPAAPTELDLRLAFGELEDFRMFSDQIVWRPVKYRLLFGPGADPELRAQIKIVKLINSPLSDGEIRSRVVRTVNDYFAASRWEFGETFYYTELAAYLHQQLAGVIGSAVVVPSGNAEAVFGDGFEVKARADEMFLSSLQVADVVLISSNTDSALRIRRS